MKNFLFYLIILFFVPMAANAQAQFHIDQIFADTGATISVPIKVSNFDNIAGAQFSPRWDTTVLTYTGATFHTVTQADNPEIGANGTYLWTETDLFFNPCNTISDGDALLTLNFQVIGAVGQSSAIYFDTAEPFEVYGCSPIATVPSTLLANGQVTVTQTTITSYGIPTDTTFCDELDASTGQAKICVPIMAFDPVSPGITGVDYCIDYDETLMTPTGILNFGNVVLDGSSNPSYYMNYVTSPGQVYVSIYNCSLLGEGEIACVEFLLNSNVTTSTTTNFDLCNGTIRISDPFASNVPASSGSWTLENDEILDGRLVFWDDISRPLRYDANNPADYLVTDISGTNSTCGNATPSATPGLDGYFEHDINDGLSISINRDIAGGNTAGPCPTSVMPFINGLDVYWTSLVTTYNNSWVPNAYQIVAMDVNMDGIVSAGDLTAIQDRIVQNDCEFLQQWNVPATQPSKDWRFIDQYTVENGPDFEVSTAYPAGDGSGYHSGQVPDVPNCLAVNYNDLNGICSYIDSMTYHGILLGDANGTWAGNTTPTNVRLENSSEITFGPKSSIVNGEVRIPVSYCGTDPILSFDFTLEYNAANLDFVAIENRAFDNTEMGMVWNGQTDGTLMFTSYSKVPGGLNSSQALFYLVFNTNTGSISQADFNTLSTYFNGSNVTPAIDFTGEACAITAINDPLDAGAILVYPNLVTNQVTIDATNYKKDLEIIALYDIHGRKIRSLAPTKNKIMQLDMSDLPAAVYFIQLDESVRKLVKQ